MNTSLYLATNVESTNFIKTMQAFLENVLREILIITSDGSGKGKSKIFGSAVRNYLVDGNLHESVSRGSDIDIFLPDREMKIEIIRYFDSNPHNWVISTWEHDSYFPTQKGSTIRSRLTVYSVPKCDICGVIYTHGPFNNCEGNFVTEHRVEIDLVTNRDLSDGERLQSADCDVNTLVADLGFNLETYSIELANIASCDPNASLEAIKENIQNRVFLEYDGSRKLPTKISHVCEFDVGYHERSQKMLDAGWKHSPNRPRCWNKKCLFYNQEFVDELPQLVI